MASSHRYKSTYSAKIKMCLIPSIQEKAMIGGISLPPWYWAEWDGGDGYQKLLGQPISANQWAPANERLSQEARYKEPEEWYHGLTSTLHMYMCICTQAHSWHIHTDKETHRHMMYMVSSFWLHFTPFFVFLFFSSRTPEMIKNNMITKW